MAALPTLLSLPEAARKYGLSEARLKTMIDNGKIKAAMIGEEIVVNEDEVREKTIQRKEDLPEYKKHAHLKGSPIWVSKAARKYNLLHPTILKWVKAGVIKRLGAIGNKILLDEADVAYCAEIYHRFGAQGRKLFDDNGMPYKAKTGPLAQKSN